MVDLTDKGSSECSMSSSSRKTPTPDRVSSGGISHGIKTCVDCGTSKTPLWRGGPAGPKSLCNACGIRSRKKRRALLGLTKEDKKSKKSSSSSNAAATPSNNNQASDVTTSNSGGGSKVLGDSALKRKLIAAIGREVVLQRPRSAVSKPRRRKLGEEEQAAFLLMALSCGSVYA